MTASKRTQVLLVEDHAVVRQSLCRLLEAEGRCGVVGQARNGREAVEMAAALSPDVILMDIAMPILNGHEATRQIIAANPAARILVLSAHSDTVYVQRMTVAGAVGFLEKQTSVAILIHAIHEVAAGRSYFSPAIARRTAAAGRMAGKLGRTRDGHVSLLTARESEVLQLVAEGQSNKEAAVTMGISIKTIEKHRQHLMNKLHLHDTAGLTRYAMVHGVIESCVHVTIT